MNGKEAVWRAAERFRQQYLADDYSYLPVDVFTLAELELELDIIPFDDLFAKYQCDAALMQDFTGIYVDAEAYILWEHGPIWKQSRLRFSVAHELGHYALHRETAAKVRFRTFDDFTRWINAHAGHKYSLEQAANEFAGRLLVPVDRLQQSLGEFADALKPLYSNWFSIAALRRLFAERTAPKFGVNDQVIEVRLDREGIWPAT
jgi:Zn-dependent peptidase ImmA (M78 family)